MYIYSLGEELGITVSEITISEIAMLLLDAIGKDNEFLLSLSPFNFIGTDISKVNAMSI